MQVTLVEFLSSLAPDLTIAVGVLGAMLYVLHPRRRLATAKAESAAADDVRGKLASAADTDPLTGRFIGAPNASHSP